MKILDKEFEVDFFDADFMERYEKEAESAKKELNNINISTMKQSEAINTVCEIIERCFDNIWGQGTSKEIFKEKRNFRLCIKAFQDLKKGKKEQEKELFSEIRSLQQEIQDIPYEYSTERIK